MLPSIKAPTKRHHSPDYEHSRHHSKKLLSDLDLKKGRNGACAPFLPFLSDSYLTSLVSRKPGITPWDTQNMKPGIPKVKQRGGGFKDYISQRSTDKSHGNYDSDPFPMIKTQDLQLRFQSSLHVNKGWSMQNPNPRLLKLQSATGKFNADISPFSFRNIDDLSALRRTLAAPHVDYLYQRKHTYTVEEKHLSSDGSTVQINDRFSFPVASAPERLPEISSPPIQPLPQHTAPASSLLKTDELICVHRNSCGCIDIGEKDSVPSRSIYNKWERKSTSLQRKKSLQSSSSSSFIISSKPRTKQQTDKPLLSPPKIPHRKISRETSLENLRKKVKKVAKQNTASQDNLDRKRHSSHSIIAKTTTSKKKLNKRESKPVPLRKEDETEVLDENDGRVIEEVEVNKDVIEREIVLHSSEPEEANDHMNDVLTVVETISTAATPSSLRQISTPRILKMRHTEGDMMTEELSSLRKVFKRLDSDGDGHLSFDEMKQGLPSSLTKRQLEYLKKIYLMACESTFFGFEEFVAVNQMCDVITHVSSSVLEAYESIEMSNIDDKLAMYMELSSYLDRKHTGSLDDTAFKELLASTLDVPHDSQLINNVLSTLGKADNNDVITSVELLVFIPYLVFVKPT